MAQGTDLYTTCTLFSLKQAWGEAGNPQSSLRTGVWFLCTFPGAGDDTYFSLLSSHRCPVPTSLTPCDKPLKAESNLVCHSSPLREPQGPLRELAAWLVGTVVFMSQHFAWQARMGGLGACVALGWAAVIMSCLHGSCWPRCCPSMERGRGAWGHPLRSCLRQGAGSGFNRGSSDAEAPELTASARLSHPTPASSNRGTIMKASIYPVLSLCRSRAH